MTRGMLAFAMASAVCLGLSLGFMGGVFFSQHHLLLPHRLELREPHGERRGPPGTPGLPPPRVLVPHLVRLLDLTPAQADAIRAEIERSRSEFADVRDSLHARLERHLTPAQRARWRAAVRERHAGEPRRRGSDPASPGAPLRAEPGTEGDLSR